MLLYKSKSWKTSFSFKPSHKNSIPLSPIELFPSRLWLGTYGLWGLRLGRKDLCRLLNCFLSRLFAGKSLILGLRKYGRNLRLWLCCCLSSVECKTCFALVFRRLGSSLVLLRCCCRSGFCRFGLSLVKWIRLRFFYLFYCWKKYLKLWVLCFLQDENNFFLINCFLK